MTVFGVDDSHVYLTNDVSFTGSLLCEEVTLVFVSILKAIFAFVTLQCLETLK